MKNQVTRPEEINTDFLRKVQLMKRMRYFRGDLQASQIFQHYMVNLFTEDIFSDPDRYVWMSFFAPPEIMHAMELFVVEPDLTAGWLCTLGYSQELLRFAEDELRIGSVCSFHKVAIAALFRKYFPVPRAAVFSSFNCDGAPKMAAYINQAFGTDFFLLDIPQTRSPGAVEYLKAQLQELVYFLSHTTKASFSLDRLRQAIRHSNRTVDLWKRAQDVRMGGPLVNGMRTLRQLIGYGDILGLAVGEEIGRAFLDELKGIKQDHTRSLSARCRLMWIGFGSYFKSILDAFEKQYQVSIVIENMCYPWYFDMQEDDPFLALAEKTLSHYLLDMPTFKEKFFGRLADQFQIDGAIHFMHKDCRCNSAISKMVEDTLKARNISFLRLNGDAIDRRAFNEEQTRTRLETFIEMVSATAGGNA